MRSRGLAVAFVLVLIAGCAGAFAAWRVARGRQAGPASTWEPPTVDVTESALPTAASIAPTSTAEAAAEPTGVPTEVPGAPTATPKPPASAVPTKTSPTTVAATSISPTVTPRKPTATRPANTKYTYILRIPARHTTDGCPGKYILGTVTDQSEILLPGVRLRTTDPWGNEATTRSMFVAGDL